MAMSRYGGLVEISPDPSLSAKQDTGERLRLTSAPSTEDEKVVNENTYRKTSRPNATRRSRTVAKVSLCSGSPGSRVSQQCFCQEN